jgi:hypothetical protein
VLSRAEFFVEFSAFQSREPILVRQDDRKPREDPATENSKATRNVGIWPLLFPFISRQNPMERGSKKKGLAFIRAPNYNCFIASKKSCKHSHC